MAKDQPVEGPDQTHGTGNRVPVPAGTGASKRQGGPGSGLTERGAQAGGQLAEDPDAHGLIVAQEFRTFDFDAAVVLFDHQVPDQIFEYGLPRGFLSTRDAPQTEERPPRAGGDRRLETRQNFVSDDVAGEPRIFIGPVYAGSNTHRMSVLGQTIPRERKERT
jgi:hypothetical protein